MYFLLCIIMYLFVVIQHSVHALNPQCVYGTIKHHPFTVWGVGRCKVTKCVRHNPICPLIMRKRLKKRLRERKGHLLSLIYTNIVNTQILYLY